MIYLVLILQLLAFNLSPIAISVAAAKVPKSPLTKIKNAAKKSSDDSSKDDAKNVVGDTVVLAALARIGDQDNKIKTTVTTRDLQINLFLNEYESFLQEYEEKRDPLKELVWEEMIFMEAKKVLNQEVSASNINDFVGQFKKKLSSDKMWTDLHVSDSELRGAVKRRVTARRLVQLKMGAKDLIFVSPEEIDSYYVQNRNQLGQRPLSEVQEKIRGGLQNLKSQERFKDWINAITRSHGVVYYSGYKVQ